MSEPAYYISDYDGSICMSRSDVNLDETQVCVVLNSQHDEIDRLRKELEKLARLGNEPEYGNSRGNDIARAALAPRAKGVSDE